MGDVEFVAGESKVQNNKELLMRTIAGFLVHPNTGAALVVSTGQDGRCRLMSRT